MILETYLHASKESLYDVGKKAGLSTEALKLFVYACYEVKVTLEVDEKSGEAKIIKVDDRSLAT